MTDYGHELQFGVFLTPAVGSAHRVVELAKLAELVGLDLVTVQDHPYQPRLMDAWTLLSYCAAETSSVRLAPNVLNLPLRQPVVLARSAATLDILSGGRVELGLGAGAFWDAIAASGGRRLSPGQSVDALSEAIDIIRAIWADSGGGLEHRGQHYQVVGAKPGPRPAHPIEIWLGALKPRMLALTGAKANGWLPSLGYAAIEDLGRMSAAIDEAAEAAGRAPSEVRRLYNITGGFGGSPEFLQGQPRDWAQQLSELTLTLGFTTFILGSDSADHLNRFAAEVVPAVRELVMDERGRAETQPEPEPVPGALSSRTLRPPASLFAVVPTPSPSRRLSRGVPWDEATRPAGPPPDPRRLFTVEEQANGQHLIDVHDALRQELERLRDLVSQVAEGTVGIGAARSFIHTMALRQNSWTLGAFCASYCRIVSSHHTLEDRSVFPHLRRRDGRLSTVVDRLEQEHRVIADILEQVDRALVAVVSQPEGMASLHQAIDLLTDALLSHLSYEERELVEPLSRLGF